MAVVGLGALGSEVCRLLGQTGASTVLTIDPDTLAARNLPFGWMYRLALPPASLLSGEVAPAMLKAEVLCSLGRQLFPATAWQSHPIEVADLGLQHLRAVDLIFSCTDHVLARAETSYLARLLGKPVIDGGLKGQGIREGRVSLLPPGRRNACYLCQFSEVRRAEILAAAFSITAGCSRLTDIPAMTATATMASLIAGIMVDLAMQPAIFNPATTSRAWIYRAPPHKRLAEPISLAVASGCPWHEPEAAEHGLPISIEPTQSIAQALAGLSRSRADGRQTVLDLLWPICLRSRCLACGSPQPTDRAPMRVARLRRSVPCTECGTTGLLDAVECLGAIPEYHRAARSTTTALGLPLDHLFWCRPEILPFGTPLRDQAPPPGHTRQA